MGASVYATCDGARGFYYFILVIYNEDMTKTVAQVREALPKRASRIQSAQLLYIINNNIRTDIQDDLYTVFKTDFDAQQEYTVATSTYEYTLPSDFFEENVLRDSSGNGIRNMYQPSTIPLKLSQSYWITSESLNLPTRAVDNGGFTVGEKLYLEYTKAIAEVTSENDELPFGARMQDKLFPLYVHGAAFFFFNTTKKQDDKAEALQLYESAKASIFSGFGSTW